MALSPVTPAPPQYGAQSPRPDLMQAAGTAALTVAAPSMMAEPEPPVIDEAFHARLVDDFEAAEDANRDNRSRAERDHDYYHGKQWSEDEVRTLKRRGQPAIALNKIREKIDYLKGLEETKRTKPRALPRTRQHEEDAQSVGDALQYVIDDNQFNRIRSTVWEDMLLVGWGGTELSVKDIKRLSPGMPAKKITLKRCPWDRMYWDPYAATDDFSDANYLGLVLWMDRAEAVRTYGDDAGKVFDETVQTVQVGGTFDDKPKMTTWIDTDRRKRVRIVQMYRIGDQGWEFWEFTKGGILNGGPSPWVNEEGDRVHPFDWTTAYIDRDNNRYGVVRDMIDPQDEMNKRRSKALHHFTARQTFGTPDVSQSVADMRKELAKPDGHVSTPPGTEWGKQFGIIPTADQGAGHLELMQQVIGFFDTVGPNASLQGKGPGSQSGRAVLANQQGGAVQMGSLTDDLRDLDYRVFCRVWNAIRQFWTGETWVRVTDDERNLKWVGLNQPATQPLMMPGTGRPIMDPQTGQPVMQPVVDPATDQPILQNPVADIDVDIIIDEAPEAGTMLDEQFNMLVQLKQFDANNEIPLKSLIRAAPNLRNKDKILEDMESREKQGPDPMQVAGVQAELQNTQADTDMKAAKAEHSRALAAVDTLAAVQSHASHIAQVKRGGVSPDLPHQHAAQARQAERRAQQPPQV